MDLEGNFVLEPLKLKVALGLVVQEGGRAIIPGNGQPLHRQVIGVVSAMVGQ